MTYAITNVTVIDMVSSVPKPYSTVVVTGNRITAVGPAETTDVPSGATVVDGTGQYLMPGLWDTHVHASRNGPGLPRGRGRLWPSGAHRHASSPGK